MYRRTKNYYECPYCHDHLDYGERCDCQNRAEERESPAVSANTTRPTIISYHGSIVAQNAMKIKEESA